MRSVGVRELRQSASALLRMVEAGETVEVTDRGRAVALLTPLPASGGLEGMRAAGDVASASGSMANLPQALEITGRRSPSSVLAGLRRHER